MALHTPITELLRLRADEYERIEAAACRVLKKK